LVVSEGLRALDEVGFKFVRKGPFLMLGIDDLEDWERRWVRRMGKMAWVGVEWIKRRKGRGEFGVRGDG